MFCGHYISNFSLFTLPYLSKQSSIIIGTQLYSWQLYTWSLNVKVTLLLGKFSLHETFGDLEIVKISVV